MVATELEVDALVWAKMKGFPPWPAKIAPPNDKVKAPNLKKPQHFVYFFGTHDYAWILDENITPHSAVMLENSKTYKKRPANLQLAIEEIGREDPGTEDRAGASPGKEREASPEKSPAVAAEKSDKTPKKSVPAARKSLAKKRPHSATLFDKLAREPEAKRRTQKKVHRKRSLSKEFQTTISHTMEIGKSEEDYEPSGESYADLPSNNGFSKVAVIPPYSEHTGRYNVPSQPSRLLDRPKFDRPATPPIDFTVSEKLKRKEIVATHKKIGFLGLGMMGRGMVKNLLNSKHSVTVWNRTGEKCEDFEREGATVATTPSDVVETCDITFCCVSDPAAAKTMVFGNWGVLRGLSGSAVHGTKGYVEMTSIDPVTSQEIAEAISDKGGRYLEAPVIGSRQLAEEGGLMILGAGDKELFDDCKSCFYALSENTFYLGCDVGTGSKMNLIVSMITGTAYAALAEAMALVDRCKLSPENFLDIMSRGLLNCPLINVKGQAMRENDYGTNTALKHQQKDMTLALSLGNSVEQPLSVSAAANELFKRARLLTYSDHDVTAVHLGAKA